MELRALLKWVLVIFSSTIIDEEAQQTTCGKTRLLLPYRRNNLHQTLFVFGAAMRAMCSRNVFGMAIRRLRFT